MLMRLSHVLLFRRGVQVSHRHRHFSSHGPNVDAEMIAAVAELNAEAAGILGPLGDPDFDLERPEVRSTSAKSGGAPKAASPGERVEIEHGLSKLGVGNAAEASLQSLLRAHHDRVISDVRLVVREELRLVMAELRRESR